MDNTSNSISDPRAHLPSVPWRYSPTAIALHWTLALLLTAMVALGWYMMSIEREPGSGWYFDLHKSIGVLVLLLVVARLIWRVQNLPQPLPASMPRWQIVLSRGIHVLLYLLMLLIPISGYLGASYSKSGVQVFGLATPHWALPDHDTAEQFFAIHSLLIWVLVALVSLHILAALKHLLLDRDHVFQRMGFKLR